MRFPVVVFLAAMFGYLIESSALADETLQIESTRRNSVGMFEIIVSFENTTPELIERLYIRCDFEDSQGGIQDSGPGLFRNVFPGQSKTETVYGRAAPSIVSVRCYED